MTTYRMCPNALHFKEFYGGYHGTCGETALATALVCATPQTETAQEAIDLMLSMTHEMISLGWASGSGSATMAHLMDEAVRRKFSFDHASYISFEQPLPSTPLHDLLLSTAGVKPIVLEIATAGAGLPGDEAGVHYHFICIVGISDAGYICNDGDNSAINSHLVTYSWAEVERATPCAVMVIDLEEGATGVGLPAGWKDTGSELTNPSNSFVVVHGFRDYILNHVWDATDVPIEDEQHGVADIELHNLPLGGGSIQRFHYSQLSWESAKNVCFKTYLGDEAKFLRDSLVAAEAEIAKLKATPVQQPLDPSIKTALSAALNILQPQAALADEVKVALSKLP